MKSAHLVLLAFAAILLSFQGASAQGNIRTYKRNGLAYYQAARYANAAEALQVYRRYEPDDAEVWLPLALSHYNLNQLGESRTLLEGLIRAKRKADPEAYLTLARIEHHEARFDKAAAWYKRFLTKAGDKHPLYAGVVDDIRRAGNGLRMGPSTGSLSAYSENIGPGINSPGDDYHPVLSPNYADRLYFTSIREGNTGGRRNANGLPDEKGSIASDMFAANFKDGRWGTANGMSALLNGPDFDEVLDFGSDGQVLLYWKGPSDYSGDIYVDTFRAKAEDRSLYSPLWAASPLKPRIGDKDLIFFNDTLILFASARPGGYGGMDIYASANREGKWSAPLNLGPQVNSAYDERCPFLAQDGRTLFFSSNRVDASVGGFDVFRAVYNERSTQWEEPQNAGLSINSGADELHFRLSASGLEAYFDSSLRTTSIGGRDIYVAYFKERQREQSLTGQPLTFLQLELAKLNNAVVSNNGFIDSPISDTEYPTPVVKQRIPVALVFSPLNYGKDDNVVTPNNLQKAAPVIKFLEQYPKSKIIITTHSDESDPDRFRNYFGIKRAERFGAYLKERNIAPSRIQYVSVGSAYGVAANDFNGQENPQGQKLNRRLELQVVPGPDYELAREYDDPKVPDYIALDAYKTYRDLQRGAVFRVQLASLGQMYDNEAYLRQPSPIITSVGDQGIYNYEVGTFSTYRSAKALASELSGKGFPEAKVIAYFDGVRLSAGDLASFAVRDAEISAMHAAQPAAE